MIIDRLILKNFKRFRDEKIEFSDGITGILGSNGAGKSSIVQAIFFALYGVQATGIEPGYIVSAFAGPKDKCEVRLDFSVGGEPYSVIRTFRKGKSVQHDAEIYQGSRLLAKGVGPVEADVRRVLGMGPVDFKNTVYAAQKDLLTLLESTPGKRKEWFLKALGLSYLSDESQKMLKERIDTAAESCQLLKGELIGVQERQDPEELARIEASVAAAKAEIAALEKDRAAHLTEKEAAEAAVRAFGEKRIAHAKLVTERDGLIREQERIKKQQEELVRRRDSLAAQEKEFGALEKEVAGIPGAKLELDRLRKAKEEAEHIRSEQQFALRERDSLAGRLARQQEVLLRLDKDAETAAGLRAEIKAALRLVGTVTDASLESLAAAKTAETAQALGKCAARTDQIAKEKKKIEQDRLTITNAGPDGTCPVCRQKLGEHFGEIEKEFAAQVAALEDEAVATLAAEEKLTKEKAALGGIAPKISRLRSLGEAQKTRETAEKERTELAAAIAEKKTAEKTLAARLAALGFDPAAYANAEKLLSDLEQVQVRYNTIARQLAQAGEVRAQLAALAKQLEENGAAQKDAAARIAADGFDPAQGTALETREKAASEALRTAETGLAGARERQKSAEEKIAAIKKEQERVKELGTRIAAAEEEIDLLKLTRSVIAEYVVYVMQVVRSRIESEVSRIIGEITGGRYEEVLLDEDFNLLVRDTDDDYPIDRFSGGEQDDIAVALRIALSRYLAELHNVQESTLLIFDEIFASQDEERRNNLLTALRTQETRFPQILLISHIPEMQGEFATTLVVEMGADQASRVREVG